MSYISSRFLVEFVVWLKFQMQIFNNYWIISFCVIAIIYYQGQSLCYLPKPKYRYHAKTESSNCFIVVKKVAVLHCGEVQ